MRRGRETEDFCSPTISPNIAVVIFGLVKSKQSRIFYERINKNPWNHLFQKLDRLPEEQAREIKIRVMESLIRLDSCSPKQIPVRPYDRLGIARVIDLGIRPKKELVRIIKINEKKINRQTIKAVVRDTHAALYYHLPEQLLRDLNITLNGQEKGRYEKIKQLEEEASKIRQALEHPPVKAALRDLPHVKALFESFAQYSTVRYFMAGMAIRGRADVKNGNNAIRDFFFSPERPIDGILFLARKGLFARWVRFGTNWYGEEINDSLQDWLSVAISQERRPGFTNERYNLRSFILAARQSPAFKNVSFTQSFQMSPELYCLFNLAKLFKDRFTSSDVAIMLHALKGLNDVKRRWVHGSLVFLENALLTSPDRMSEDKLYRNNHQLLRIARQQIQKVLK